MTVTYNYKFKARSNYYFYFNKIVYCLINYFKSIEEEASKLCDYYHRC